MGLEILDISTPSNPIVSTLNETFLHISPLSLTKEENTILIGYTQFFQNTSLMKIKIDQDPNKIIEVDVWNSIIKKMVLRNDTLYSMITRNEEYFFLIHNATNIEDMNLLGNTSVDFYPYPHNYENFPDFYKHENNCFFITKEENLAVFQVNNTNQLSFIREYNFTNLKSMYFNEEYLFACDEIGLRIFNYSNVENLDLVKQYIIADAQSVQVNNEIAYLVTKKQFITLDISNLEEIRIMDQYVLGNREPLDLMKVEMKNNLAIVMTEDWITNYVGYSWYLYIFDITTPYKIKRIYPVNLPIDFWGTLKIVMYVFLAAIPVCIITVVVLVTTRNKKLKGKNIVE
ncbi:MAG: hypothetical protein KGD59_11520 [Candidatus Heimdallarchaeota archaeon]|nr:hypothetical protein [Candidatus Heimdallarchaeota archaeon]MBY8995172.1 hypothetical protein [Candidatus Heimdallarchaeota archaeon]